ncbi:NADP-dependent oxidoreductase [Arthrobacter sp. B0490]|uniref:quinone oxidoreductase family protein n=1 Tax=Arthrobacter sp. B0490 TaxID=2058891 RepID=UPI000CE4AC97|nr:NADP-dependent oxidoreductase [Arthrobacter sp. B0490]
MRAAVVREFGGTENIRVEELPIPEPGEGEVRVRVHYTPVNPTDVMLRAGLQAKAFESIPQPWIPGLEFAGVVDKITGAPQDNIDVGAKVMGIVSPRRAEGGAQAEYVIVPSGDVAAVPDGLSLEAASMIPMNGLTAGMVIDRLEPDSSKTVLVTGAGGILGGYVVQLARRAGMSVIAQGRASDQRTLEELGAAAVITSDDDLVAAVKRIAPEGVDGVVDAANIGVDVEEALRDGGILVQVLPKQLPETTRITRRSLSVLEAYGAPETLSEKARNAGLEVLTPRVADVVPVEHVSQVHEAVEAGGKRGRIVLDFRDRGDRAS